jgi:hypothetical protein
LVMLARPLASFLHDTTSLRLIGLQNVGPGWS